MKTLTLLLALLGLAILVAPINAQTDPALPSSPYSLIITGSDGTLYCDFFDMVPVPGTALLPGTHNLSTNCGLADNFTIGAGGFYFKIVPFAPLGSGMTIGDAVDYSQGAPIAQIYNFNFGKKTWATYYWDGTNFVQFLHGTFQIGPPGGAPNYVGVKGHTSLARFK
jgi:hypothetical protein